MANAFTSAPANHGKTEWRPDIEENANLDWGGNWSGWQDLPHIEIPLNRLFKNSLDLDEGLQWQKYLFQGGALTEPEDLDGIFGEHFKAALQALVGTGERTPDAWENLYIKYGPVESLTTFQQYAWIPAVL